MNTDELAGSALDWAVWSIEFAHVTNDDELLHALSPYSPSTNWELAGPIIEREKIGITFNPEWEVPNWSAWPTAIDDRQEIMGETPLTAALRCYVAIKLGRTVEIPAGLTLKGFEVDTDFD